MNEDIAERLAASLPGEVSPEKLRALVPRARERHLQPGETLLRQGEAAAHIYVVVTGRLRAEVHDGSDAPHRFTPLEAGTVLGEIAVLTGGRREATVVAETAVTIIELAVADFQRLLASDPECAQRITELATQRLRETQLARQLKRLFPEVSESGRNAILASVDWMHLQAGEYLVRRGDPADCAYVLVSGRLRVTDDEGARVGGAEVGPGELVGEMALVEGGSRSATLVAVRDAQVARIARDAFLDALRDHPEALLRIAQMALQRTMSNNIQKQGEDRRTIALVALHPQVDLPAFAGALATELARVDIAGLLTQTHAQETAGAQGLAVAGPGSPGFARLAQWLQEQEVRYDTLLLQTSADWGPWNDLVLRHADHVVLVADAAADPAWTAAETRSHDALGARVDRHSASRVRQSLVLVHAERGPGETECPCGTARWLEPRSVDACYHLRRGHADDLSRLARILAERPITLVLSGGGARGLAHLGVMRALREAGVPVDVVAGTSIGAVIATLVALDIEPEEQAALAKTVLTRSLLDWTLPLVGLIKGSQMRERADFVTGGRDIEDLWLPLFIVSTNLTRSQVAVHRQGSITRALRASTTIPGVLPPVVYGDDLHVDGGVLDNVPVEPMRRAYPRGQIIAVDVAEATGVPAREDFGLSVSGWGLLARRLLPGTRAPQVPGIAATLIQSMLAGSSQGRDRVISGDLADLYLDLDLPRCGLFQFEAADRIIAAGHAAATARVREWTASLPPEMRVASDNGRVGRTP